MYARRAKIRCYGRISLTVCMTAFVYAWIVFNVVFLGRIVPVVGSYVLILVVGLPTNLLWILAVWSYLRCCLTDPGRIADEWRAFVKEQSGLNIVEGKAEWQPGQATTSDKTPEVRPERAHYCKVCNVDFLRMDHFCPWVGNCIGFRNYKFFILAMFYVDVCCVVGLFVMLSVVLGKLYIMSSNDGAMVWFLGAGDTAWLVSLVILACLALGAFTYVLVHHFPKALRNVTSIEKKYKNMPNPYDQLSRKENLAQVFGAFGWDWFLPIMPRRPQSDGYSFRKSCEVLPEGMIETYVDEEDGIVPLLCEQADHSQESESDDSARIEEIWRYRYTQRYAAAAANEEEEEEEEEADEEPTSANTALVCCRRKKPRSVERKTRSVAPAIASPASYSLPTVATSSAPLLLPQANSLQAAPVTSVTRIACNQPALRLAPSESPRTLPPVQIEPKGYTALLPAAQRMPSVVLSAAPALAPSARLVQLQPQAQPAGIVL